MWGLKKSLPAFHGSMNSHCLMELLETHSSMNYCWSSMVPWTIIVGVPQFLFLGTITVEVRRLYELPNYHCWSSMIPWTIIARVQWSYELSLLECMVLWTTEHHCWSSMVPWTIIVGVLWIITVGVPWSCKLSLSGFHGPMNYYCWSSMVLWTIIVRVPWFYELSSLEFHGSMNHHCWRSLIWWFYDLSLNYLALQHRNCKCHKDTKATSK